MSLWCQSLDAGAVLTRGAGYSAGSWSSACACCPLPPPPHCPSGWWPQAALTSRHKPCTAADTPGPPGSAPADWHVGHLYPGEDCGQAGQHADLVGAAEPGQGGQHVLAAVGHVGQGLLHLLGEVAADNWHKVHGLLLKSGLIVVIFNDLPHSHHVCIFQS